MMMHGSNILFSVIITINVVTGILSPPKYLWPLSGESFSFEVKNGRDGQFPGNYDCFTVGPGYPNLSFSAMYFDRSPNSYADVSIPSVQIYNVGLSALFYPMDGDGVIFHYRSDNQAPSDYVTEMNVRLDGGKLKASIDTQQVGVRKLDFPLQTVSDNVWSMVTFTNSYLGTSSLYINTYTESITHGYRYPLSTPGKLRFGASLSSSWPVSLFKGFITCGALYTVAFGFDHFQDMLQHCTKSNWPNTAPIPVCIKWFEETTTVSVTTEPPKRKPTALHIWPMDDATGGYDVVTMENSRNANYLRFGEPHPYFPHNSIHFDGSVMSGLQTTIKFNEIFGSFTLTGYILPRSSTSGVVFQVIFVNRLTTLFRVYVDEGNLLFKSFDSVGGACYNVSLSGAIIADQWQLLAIEKGVVTKNWAILIDSTRYPANSICGDWAMSNQDAAVSVGATVSDVFGFYGDMRCLIMFDGIFDEDGVDTEMKDICLGNTISGTPLNLSSSELRNRRHILLKTDYRHPDDIQSTTSMITKSLTYCAVQCYSSAYCRSFSWKQNGGCLLYDFVSVKGLVTSVGTNYYAIRN